MTRSQACGGVARNDKKDTGGKRRMRLDLSRRIKISQSGEVKDSRVGRPDPIWARLKENRQDRLKWLELATALIALQNKPWT